MNKTDLIGSIVDQKIDVPEPRKKSLIFSRCFFIVIFQNNCMY